MSKDLPHRRSIRLRTYDYTLPGAYFVTLCVKHRQPLFGKIIGGEMRLNEIGEIVRDEWFRSAQIRAEIQLDEFVVMPDHIHGIVIITENNMDVSNVLLTRVDGRPPLQRIGRSLGSMIAGFKSAVTVRINTLRGTPGIPVWQREYHDRIVRNDGGLERIRQYIRDNPMRWEMKRLSQRT